MTRRTVEESIEIDAMLLRQAGAFRYGDRTGVFHWRNIDVEAFVDSANTKITLGSRNNFISIQLIATGCYFGGKRY